MATKLILMQQLDFLTSNLLLVNLKQLLLLEMGMMQ